MKTIKQIFASLTPEERLELLLLMLRKIEARRSSHPFRAHYIKPHRRNPFLRISIFFILGVLSFTVWMIALHVHPAVGAPLVLFYDLAILLFLLIRPTRWAPIVNK